MKTSEHGYNAKGYRKVGDEVYYPYWCLTIRGGDLAHEEELDFGAAKPENILEVIQVLSRASPTRWFQLSASARVRLTMLNGEIVSDNRFGDVYVPEDKDKEEIAIFDNLVCADHDGMGKFLLPETLQCK